MNLGKYIFYRLIGLFGQLFGAIALIFAMLKVIPYDPTLFYLINYRGSNPAEQENLVNSLRASLGLDKSLIEQYFDFLTDLFVHRSLGVSWQTGRPILDMITSALPYTFITFGLAFLIYTPIAIGLGIVAARLRGGIFDNFMRVMTTATYAVPSYILGLWIIVYISTNASASWPRPAPEGFDMVRYSFFPILVVVLVYTGFQFRLVRAQMLEILRADYIRTARAKGLSERTILYKHALRNGLPFFITTIAVTFPIAFSGVAALEVVFNIPGIGLMMVQAANGFDWPVLIGVTAIFTMFNAFILGMTDVLIQLVDPKLRLNLRFSYN